jgi:hypothetical protein
MAPPTERPTPQQVPPSPVPTLMEVGGATAANGQKYVVLGFQTPIGQHVFHIDVDAAEQLAEGILAAREQLGPASGLVIPQLSPEAMRRINDEARAGRTPS